MLSQKLEEEILGLKPDEKIRLVETILRSMDQEDPEIEKKWVEESDKRYKYYKEGKLKGVALEKIKNRFEP